MHLSSERQIATIYHCGLSTAFIETCCRQTDSGAQLNVLILQQRAVTYTKRKWHAEA